MHSSPSDALRKLIYRLFGIVTVQTFSYFGHFPKDKVWLKSVVGLLHLFLIHYATEISIRAASWAFPSWRLAAYGMTAYTCCSTSPSLTDFPQFGSRICEGATMCVPAAMPSSANVLANHIASNNTQSLQSVHGVPRGRHGLGVWQSAIWLSCFACHSTMVHIPS